MSQLQPGPSYDAYIPGGAHSNSRLRHGKPVVASRASGSRVVDEHGREYLDFIMGNGAVVLGHAAPEVVAAVSDCVARGLTTGVESTFAMEAAESIRSLIPEPGMIRFATRVPRRFSIASTLRALPPGGPCLPRQRAPIMVGRHHSMCQPGRVPRTGAR